MNKFITLHGLAVFWEELKTRIVQKTDLATVATTGKYSDLIGTPSTDLSAYAPKASPTFTGTVTAPNLTVTASLAIPGGKVWVG